MVKNVSDNLSKIISKADNIRNNNTDAANKNKNVSEFLDILNEVKVSKQSSVEDNITISNHAQKRIKERNLGVDGEEFLKLKGAFDKLKNKGGQDSLVITDKAAYIVDVDNKTVVTAMNKDDMAENVFTKIDSTLFIN